MARTACAAYISPKRFRFAASRPTARRRESDQVLSAKSVAETWPASGPPPEKWSDLNYVF
jgi:hypothetical protein